MGGRVCVYSSTGTAYSGCTYYNNVILSAGSIVGIVIGSLIGVAVIIALIVLICKLAQRKSAPSYPPNAYNVPANVHYYRNPTDSINTYTSFKPPPYSEASTSTSFYGNS